jgi:hypothetical protein
VQREEFLLFFLHFFFSTWQKWKNVIKNAISPLARRVAIALVKNSLLKRERNQSQSFVFDFE